MWNHHDLNIRDHSSAAWLHVRPPRDRGRLSRDGSLHLNVCRWWQTSFLPLVSSTSAQLSRCFLPCLISSLSHISGHSHSLPLAFLPFPLLGLPTVCSLPPTSASFVYFFLLLPCFLPPAALILLRQMSVAPSALLPLCFIVHIAHDGGAGCSL